MGKVHLVEQICCAVFVFSLTFESFGDQYEKAWNCSSWIVDRKPEKQ